MTLLSKTNVAGTDYGTMPKVPMGTSSTPAGTEIKVCSFTDSFELSAGNLISVIFTYANTYGDGSTTFPKLNINGIAYPVKYTTGSYASSGAWSDGQAVAFMFDGTYFLMKEPTPKKVKNVKEFTYVVNSDASLQYWLTNGTSGTSSGGNDFTSVLIKKGTYTVNYATANLSDIGTKYVEGETGNCINNYNILFHDMADYSGYDPTYCFENLYIVNHLSAGPTIKAFRMVRGVHNCRVDVSATGASTATAFGYYTFDTCHNISEVVIDFTDGASFNDWQQGVLAGFYSCQRLSKCTVTSDWNVTSGSSSSMVYGFISCVDVTNCRVSAYAMGHGIGSCKRVLHCAVVGYSITDKYGSSYATESATSTYACADTANGGWNS